MKPHWVKIKTVEIAFPSAVLSHTLGKIPELKCCMNRWETQQNSWWLHIMSLNGRGRGEGKATITKIHSEYIYLLRFSSVMFEMGKVINMQTSMNIVIAKSVKYDSLAATDNHGSSNGNRLFPCLGASLPNPLHPHREPVTYKLWDLRIM